MNLSEERNRKEALTTHSVDGFSARILLVEDNPNYVYVVKRHLQKSAPNQFDITNIDRLNRALELLNKSSYDLVLLDLTLPDMKGIETLVRVRDHSPSVPIIVLTGIVDKKMAIKSVQSGAQDYLTKENVTPELLLRSILYAIERNQLLLKLHEHRPSTDYELEARYLDQLTQASSITARLQSTVTLHEAEAAVFESLSDDYGNLIDLAMERLVHGADFDLPDKIKALANQLGILRAGPRDVIEIHMNALQNRCENVAPEKKQAIVAEARIIVLETMGYLVSYYRNYAVSNRSLVPTSDSAPAGPSPTLKEGKKQ